MGVCWWEGGKVERVRIDEYGEMGMLGNGKTKREWKNGGKMDARRILTEIGRLTGSLGFYAPTLLNSHCNSFIPRLKVHQRFSESHQCFVEILSSALLLLCLSFKCSICLPSPVACASELEARRSLTLPSFM
ncbi:hypothetical protein HAX54_026065, partial [Datura stramonium]|nr:hypothetical protein [Datura stramonium]